MKFLEPSIYQVMCLFQTRALTLGSALPHLFNAFSPLDWRITIATASACAFAGALMINLVKTGPGQLPASKLELGLAFRLLKRRSLRLANFGYLGHMWELYAMWAWIGPFLDWSLKRQGYLQGNPALMTFLVVSSGLLLPTQHSLWLWGRTPVRRSSTSRAPQIVQRLEETAAA